MSNNFLLLMPEFLVTGLAFAVLSLDFVLRREHKHMLGYVSAIGLVAILAVALAQLWSTRDELYDGLLVVDGYSLFFKGFFLALGAVVILASVEYVRRHLDHPGEYYGIVLFSVVAMMLLAMSGELLTAYIALELLSFSLYVLVSYDRYNPKSNEAGTKYILLGALSSALLLYGISQVYGLLGTTSFEGISEALAASPDLSPGVLVGLTLIIAGLGFKVAAVPFHMWAPDAYEGAPIPYNGLPRGRDRRLRHFALALRLFVEALMPAAADWQTIVIVMAALTMVLGNLVALAQSNIKRLLAYSSIGHVGYLLMGIAALASVDSDGRVSTSLSHLASNGIMLHSGGLRHHQHGRLPVDKRGVQRDSKRGDSQPRRPVQALACRGNGARGGAVLARRAADIRRIRQQVLPFQRGGRAGAALAGGTRHLRQRHITLLLPVHSASDVHRARG